jgi:hypothetical protein
MTITVEYDIEADAHVLMVSDGRMRPMPAGVPACATREEAEKAAAELRKRLAAQGTVKKAKKTDRENWA